MALLLFSTLCDTMNFSMPYFSVLHNLSLLNLMSIESVMPSNHLILYHPHLLSPSVFQASESFPVNCLFYIKWSQYWTFSFSISLSSEYSGFISFRIDWFELLAVQGTLKSFLQHHSCKASLFGAQPSLWSNSRIHT